MKDFAVGSRRTFSFYRTGDLDRRDNGCRINNAIGTLNRIAQRCISAEIKSEIKCKIMKSESIRTITIGIKINSSIVRKLIFPFSVYRKDRLSQPFVEITYRAMQKSYTRRDDKNFVRVDVGAT